MRPLVLIAILVLACDDPEVAEKAADILTHGVVSAQATCSVTSENALGGSAIMSYQATRFFDGSAMAVAGSASMGNTVFFERGSAEQSALTVPLRLSFGSNDRIELSFDGGDVVVFEPTASPSDTPDTCAVGTCCSGFNLEAFE